MRSHIPLLALSVAFAWVACEPEAPLSSSDAPVSPSAAPDAPALPQEASAELPPRFLPAHRLPHERKIPGKADQYDDFRNANPQWFAITEAPAGQFRPMLEWEPMSRLWTTYSDYLTNSAGVSKTIVNIIKHTVLDAATPVSVVVFSDNAYNTLRQQLLTAGLTNTQLNSMVEFYRKANDSIWFIDYGPVPIVRADGKVAFTDYRYYHPRTRDDALSSVIGLEKDITTYRMPVDIEGGTFQADGNGNCFTATRGLQNAGMTEAQLEAVWGPYHGCQNVVVLKDITDDGTGHIDMFFKVVDSNNVIVGEYKSQYVNDATNKARMDDNAALLSSLIGANGQPITVHRIPFPAKKNGVPRTYINSTFVNGVNLWPIYSDAKTAEAEALQKWQQIMPTYEHIGILSDEIAQQSGTIHCVTRTVPTGSLTPWIPNGTCSGGTCNNANAAGYNGECSATIPCEGPKWLCGCNNCAFCDGSGSSCEGNCGGEAPAGCFCDSQCVQYNDCCDDYQQQCVCQPQCSGKQCGSNGCGGSCGTCAAGSTCNASGQCVATCTPQCGGKQCGSNGCGGSCGTCAAGSTCNASGQCVATCTPQCGGKQCGSDGCGGSCGTCAAGSTCNASGQCVATAGGSCVGKCGVQSGPNGCWCDNQCAQYGDCCADYQQVCVVGTCEGNCGGKSDGACYCDAQCTQSNDCCTDYQAECVCQPQCGGKQCGSNGCGGSCGTCAAGSTCNASGQCVAACTPQCGGKQCGSNGCGGSCGTCAAGSTCNASGQCVAACTPNCNGKECGSDGCGGSCGTCGAAPQCDTPGDADGNGIVNITDTQCVLLVALWELDGAGAAPSCVQGNPDSADLDCSGASTPSASTVVDVSLSIQLALGQPLATAIDTDGDKCPNSCEVAMSCSTGACVYGGP
jgi:agmatine/peptidylarginine deiminase